MWFEDHCGLWLWKKQTRYLCRQEEVLEKIHDPFRKLDLLLELIPFKYSLWGEREKV